MRSPWDHLNILARYRSVLHMNRVSTERHIILFKATLYTIFPSRVKTRRGVSGPKMDLPCQPDMWGNIRGFGHAVFPGLAVNLYLTFPLDRLWTQLGPHVAGSYSVHSLYLAHTWCEQYGPPVVRSCSVYSLCLPQTWFGFILPPLDLLCLGSKLWNQPLAAWTHRLTQNSCVSLGPAVALTHYDSFGPIYCGSDLL